VKQFVLTLVMLVASVTAVPAAEKIYRLGFLEPTAAAAEITRSVMLPELATLGFREQVNLAVDERVGDAAAFPRLAQELVLSRPDAIVAFGGNAVRAAHNATSTIPIVTFGPDLIQMGLATSLARPNGNVTGVVVLGVELDAKRLELLHETVPTARRMAALVTRSPNKLTEDAMRAVAANNGIELLVFEGDGPDDYPAAFAAMHAAGAQALATTSGPYFNRDAALLARLALEAGLPTICEVAESAHSGCLLGYGLDRSELGRRMAHQVARIFRGAAPGDLPIEQPTHYKFTINLKTAKALGLTVPQALLARADEVIE
jgi:putative ABC transport system substrate-binding protein